MDWIDYREQLGIGFDDEKKRRYFITNDFSLLNNNEEEQIPLAIYVHFCMETGTAFSVDPYKSNYYDYILGVLSEHTKSIKDFVAYYIAFIHAIYAEENDEKLDYLRLIKEQLKKAHIDYEIIKDDGKPYLFPKGVAQFDKALVTDNLTWLKEYPDVKSAWSKALYSYANLNENNASEVADGFRKALERMYQSFFSGGKSLENYKSEYSTFLKTCGIPKEISNDFVKLMDLYTDFNNNYAKHKDGTKKNVIEYIMYQTGNIIRLLITLKQGE